MPQSCRILEEIALPALCLYGVAPSHGRGGCMRTVKFAGAAALACVGLTLVSAELIRTAVGQQLQSARPDSTRLDSARVDSAQPAATRVALASGHAAGPDGDRGATAEALARPVNGPPGQGLVEGTAEQAGPRLALVIGNAAYPDGDAPLTAAVADARMVADTLRRRGFDVELGENLSKPAMERAVERFQGKLVPGATALLYYSGHGAQIGRESFLIPVSAQIWRPEDVRRDAVSLEPLVAEMSARGAARKLVVVDAARRNPFERRLRGFSSGLAPIAGPEGTLVLYAVAPGKVADQTGDGPSVFARELVAQLGAAGLTVEQAFNRTRLAVARATGGAQVPAVFSAMTDEFSFDPPAEQPTPTRQSAR
ncbi:hypothetical protein CH340_16830 [Rhodoplanes serenus]|nr:hypothetical protein CH340_16830 [Rhodoplanes serenus]